MPSRLQFVTDDEGDELLIPATVDYGTPFVDLVVGGNYRYPDPDVTAERFSRPGSGQRTLFFRILEIAGGRMDACDALVACNSHPVRVATLVELLAVARAFPELPFDGRLAALGSRWDDPRGVSRYGLVQRYNERRYLDMHPSHFLWLKGDRFLVAPRDGEAA